MAGAYLVLNRDDNLHKDIVLGLGVTPGHASPQLSPNLVVLLSSCWEATNGI
jgi:hypothetical protein